MSNKGTYLPKNLNLGETKPVAAFAYRRRTRTPPQPNNTFTATQQISIPLDTVTPGSFLDTKNSYLQFDVTINNTNPYIDYHSFGSAGASVFIEKLEIQCNNIAIETIYNYNLVVSQMNELAGFDGQDYPLYLSRSAVIPSLSGEGDYNNVKKPMIDRSGRIMFANNTYNSWVISGSSPAFQNNSLLGTPAVQGTTGCYNGTQSVFPYTGITRGDQSYIRGQVGAAQGTTALLANTSTGIIPSEDNPLSWPYTIGVTSVNPTITNLIKKRVQDYIPTLQNVINVPIGCQGTIAPDGAGNTSGTATATINGIANTSITTMAGTAAGFYSWLSWWNAQGTSSTAGELKCFSPGSFTSKVQISLMSGTLGILQEKLFPAFMCGDLKIVATLTTNNLALQCSMDPCRRILGSHRDWCPYTGAMLKWKSISNVAYIGYSTGNTNNSQAISSLSTAIDTDGWWGGNRKLSYYLGGSGIGSGLVHTMGSPFGLLIGGAAGNTQGYTFDSETGGAFTSPAVPLSLYPTNFSQNQQGDAWQYRFVPVFSPHMYSANSNIPQYYLPSLQQGSFSGTFSYVGTGQPSIAALVWGTGGSVVGFQFGSFGTPCVPAQCWVIGGYSSGNQGDFVTPLGCTNGGLGQDLNTVSSVLDTNEFKGSIPFIGYDGEQCFGTFLKASVPQSHRCFYNGLVPPGTSSSANNTFQGQYNSGGQDRLPSFTISNVYYVAEQIILPDALTAKILAGAVSEDLSLMSKTYRTYGLLSMPLSTTQSIQIPAKLASCDALWFIFRPGSMLGQGSSAQSQYIPYLVDSMRGVCPYGGFQFTTDQGSFIGTTNAPLLQYIPVTGNTYSAQLQIGNDLVPQQPYQNLSEMSVELDKTFHSYNVDWNKYINFSIIPDPTTTYSTNWPASTSNPTLNWVYDIMVDKSYATCWVSPLALQDQTIINNAAYQYCIDPANIITQVTGSSTAPLFGADNAYTAASYNILSNSYGFDTTGQTLSNKHLNTVGGTVTASNPCATPVGGYIVNQFIQPRSTFVLGFDLDSFPGTNDVCLSGRYLGNVAIYLALQGAYGLALDENYYLTAIAMCDMRLSFQAGGVINGFI